MKFIKALPASRDIYLIPCSNPNDPLYLEFPEKREICIYEEKGRIFISQIKTFSDNIKEYKLIRNFHLYLGSKGPYPELKRHFIISTDRRIDVINDKNNHLVEVTKTSSRPIYLAKEKIVAFICDLN